MGRNDKKTKILKRSKLYSHCLGMNCYVNFLGDLGSNELYIKGRFGTMSVDKKQNLGGHFGAINTANIARFAQFLGKRAKLAVLFS